MKKIILLMIISLGWFIVIAQPNYILWSFETGDRVLSHPVIDNNIIYFGSNDNKVYAVDASTGGEIWSFDAGYNVQSPVALNEDLLYFESGNNCYALDKTTGLESWSFVSNDPDGTEKLDPWDYHHASPVIYGNDVYFGCGNGRLYGFDLISGNLTMQYEALDTAAIRSTPAIDNGVIYFGDWDGRIYALDIVSQDTIWTARTYDTQPYPTFGQVNTHMLVYDSLLLFGARNPTLQVFNKNNGNLVWDYTVPGGGWISGDPLVQHDTLFIGGSDCNRFFAFNVFTGEMYWSYTFLYNNFSKPLICENYIVFTTGNAYAYQGTNYGIGYLYALNKSDGEIHNFFQVGGNVFTSPAFMDNKLFMGSSDKHLYAIDSSLFMGGITDIRTTGCQSVDIVNLYPNPFEDSISIEYSIEYRSKIDIRIVDMKGRIVRGLISEELKTGNYSISWDGRDNSGQLVPEGLYIIEINSIKFKRSEVILKQ